MLFLVTLDPPRIDSTIPPGCNLDLDLPGQLPQDGPCGPIGEKGSFRAPLSP